MPCHSYRTPRFFFFRLAVVALAFAIDYFTVITFLIVFAFIIH